MKEFDHKCLPRGLYAKKVRAEAFTHMHLGRNRKEELSQLDCIIGPTSRNDEVCIHYA